METKKQYTNEEKIEFYSKKLTIALAAGGAAKNVFEAMFYSEQAYWITDRLYKLMRNSDLNTNIK